MREFLRRLFVAAWLLAALLTLGGLWALVAANDGKVIFGFIVAADGFLALVQYVALGRANPAAMFAKRDV